MRSSWRLLSWAPLRRWGNHVLVRSAPVWALVIPLLTTWLAPIALRRDAVVLGENLPIRLGLPFNWLTLYLAILTFTAVRAIYAWRCPAIIRRFESFSDFRASHLGITQLVHQVWELIRQMPPPDLERFHQLFKVALQMEQGDTSEGDRIYEEVSALPDFERRMSLFDWYRRTILTAQHEDLLSDLFDVVRHQAGLLHPVSILSTAILVRLGVLLMVLVIVQTGIYLSRLAAEQHMTINQVIFGG